MVLGKLSNVVLHRLWQGYATRAAGHALSAVRHWLGTQNLLQCATGAQDEAVAGLGACVLPPGLLILEMCAPLRCV